MLNSRKAIVKDHVLHVKKILFMLSSSEIILSILDISMLLLNYHYGIIDNNGYVSGNNFEHQIFIFLANR